MMRFPRTGWILITIFLLNLSVGMFWRAVPQQHLPEKPDTTTSEAGTRHIPADLQMDADTLSVTGPQFSSAAADLLRARIDDRNLNPTGISTVETPTYVQSDLLQLQHVLRI